MTAVALHHELAGAEDAAPLLLGSSLGTTLAMWDPQVPSLAARLRVIRFDHRGHGRSPVPRGPYAMADLGADVLELLDRLGIERASYCGISMGAMVGLWLAANARERIDRLVLIGASAHVPAPSAWTERAARVREAGSPAVIADTVVGRWFTSGFAREHPDVVERHRAMIAATPAESYAGCCEAIAELDLEAALPGIRASTLVLAGGEDPSIPPEHGRAIAESVPGARFQVIEPAAHLASVEQAEAVTRLIVEHMAN
ncbi:MAG TPA: 3-oxoadipate enol-lactonase [Solirubrobacteraceae bacterium]|jgi:3-oxoadipate enol-lactonase|nr:3-oxoadipate enol-lactonase [Solirubrobacteraceae bacterium]